MTTPTDWVTLDHLQTSRGGSNAITLGFYRVDNKTKGRLYPPTAFLLDQPE